jgi:hypothetical protein
MSLETLLAPIPSRVTKLCRVGRIIEGLDEPYKTAVINLVNLHRANGGLTEAELSSRFAEANLQASASVIYTHRSGHCACRKLAVA